MASATCDRADAGGMTLLSLVSDSGFRGVTVEDCVLYGAWFGIGEDVALAWLAQLMGEGTVVRRGDRLHLHCYAW